MFTIGVICCEYLQNVQLEWREEWTAYTIIISYHPTFPETVVALPLKTNSAVGTLTVLIIHYSVLELI